MQPTETIQVETETVGCDGGGGALGHPLVYLTLDNGGKADCPYCGRRFVLKEGAFQGFSPLRVPADSLTTFTNLRHPPPAAIRRVRGKIVTPCFTVGCGNNKLELIRLPTVQSPPAIKRFPGRSPVPFLLSGHAAQKKVVLRGPDLP